MTKAINLSEAIALVGILQLCQQENLSVQLEFDNGRSYQVDPDNPTAIPDIKQGPSGWTIEIGNYTVEGHLSPDLTGIVTDGLYILAELDRQSELLTKNPPLEFTP